MPLSDASAEFDPGAILRALHTHGVRFVVIGGFTALAHGSPFPTEDIDITPEASTDNFHRLSASLGSLEARIRSSSTSGGLPFAHDAASLAAVETWNLVTRHGDLAIAITPSGTAGYPDISRDAVQIEASGATARFASLADVVRSKQAANRPKDQRVLPTLRELLAERHAERRDYPR